MLKLKLWVVALALVVGLSSAQAWACPSRGSEKQIKGHDSSIRLTTAKRADLSFLSQRAVEVPVLSKRLAGSKGREIALSHARGRHDHIARTRHGNGQAVRGLEHRSPTSPAPSGQAAAPIPEPSALMCFGVGLLMARRAVGGKRGAR